VRRRVLPPPPVSAAAARSSAATHPQASVAVRAFALALNQYNKISNLCLSYCFTNPNGYRLPSNIWCGVALFGDLSAAEEALETKEHYLPYLADAVESWHALLLPIAHRGECNHIERSNPGPELDLARVIDFRVHVDRVHDWLKTVEGRGASQVFTPYTVGDDGVTMSVWRSDTVMIGSMYRPGTHRTQIDRYKSEKTADRTSFTRFRVLRTSGRWGGTDPMEIAGGNVT